jgi:glutamate-1-semialdehyde 2,1-aminomutase
MTNLELAVSDPSRTLNEGYDSRALDNYLTRADGCRVWDQAGREYIDLAMGGGSTILGHAHPVVVEAVREQVGRGSIFASPHAAVHEMGELLAKCLPWFGGFVFCNSGSEAVMRLARIARAVTGRRKIGLFSGCWHGSWDGTLVEDYTGPAVRPVAGCKSAGTLSDVVDSIMLLPYRDSAALSLIRENKDDLACVLIEPVQGSNPSDGVGDFLSNLRHTTTNCGVLLAFDEVVTGFRLGLGGGQEHFGVHGDLAAYGKIVGGGLPVGMVAGTKAVMEEAQRLGVFFGGTFSANPLTIAAGLATLRQLGLGPNVYLGLERAGRVLRSLVNHYCAENALPAHMVGAGSISRLVLSGNEVRSRRERDMLEPPLEAQARFYANVKARGMWIGTNRIQFLSTAHGLDEVGTAADALCASLLQRSKREV